MKPSPSVLRFAMGAGKSLRVAVLSVLVAIGFSVGAAAQDGPVAPPLFGVAEIVVQWAEFSNPEAATACDLSRESVMKNLLKNLAEQKLPVIAVSDAKPAQKDVARIRLTPTVATLRDPMVHCASWIELRAEDVYALRLPPLPPRKNVRVTYWQQGGLILSAVGTHGKAVLDGFKQLSNLFVTAYRQDQPHGLPVPENSP